MHGWSPESEIDEDGLGSDATSEMSYEFFIH